MRKRLLVLSAILLAGLAVWMFTAGETEAQGGCTGNGCLVCLGFTCSFEQMSGHCECYFDAEPPGRFCIAGGGTCIPTY